MSDGRVRLVELSHTSTAGMTTYPSMPGPEMRPHLTREASRGAYAEGTEFVIDRITMLGNTGTYLDSPYHRYPDGADLAALPLSTLVDLPAVVVRVSDGTRAVDAGAFDGLDVAGTRCCCTPAGTGTGAPRGTLATRPT
jgi:arylformamidase